MIDFVIHIKELEIDNGKKLNFIVLYKKISKKPIPNQIVLAIFYRTENENTLISSFAVLIAEVKKIDSVAAIFIMVFL